MTKANEILTAAVATLDQRGKDYDQPDGERSMGRIVAAFNALTGHEMTEAEGWQFMAVLKLVRMDTAADPTDSAVDCAAYAALAGEALWHEKERTSRNKAALKDAHAASEPEPQAKGKEIDPDADGWIPCGDGPRFVGKEKETVAEVKFNDGETMLGRANQFHWACFGSGQGALAFPIVAYRVYSVGSQAPAAEKKDEPWKPQEREQYHYIDVDGLVESTRFFASDTKDILRIAFGNCFRTEQEAEAKRSEIFEG